MSSTYKDNPFRPDFGGMPPVLAGRNKELIELNTGLEQLQDGITPPAVVISAPRGMGKSVLLNKVEQDANRAGIKISKTNAGTIKTLQHLTGWLAPDLVKAARAGGFRLGWKLLSAGLDFTRSRGEALGAPEWPVLLQDALLKRHKKKPLIICVDEAHVLETEVAQALGNLRHRMNDTKRPVWLLLAGTPGLDATLQAVKTTFIERMKRLNPILLSEAESAEVVQAPLVERGWQVSEEALANLVADSSGYPYFLQLWGSEVWKAGVALGRTGLDGDTLARAAVDVNRRRDEFYFHRYVELIKDTAQSEPFRELDLAAVTLAVITVARRIGGATLPEVMGAIRTSLPPQENPVPLLDYFEARGFIWAATPNRYVPGIPSLMDYIEEQFAGR